jgi:CheY-like chemotaxis protein
LIDDEEPVNFLNSMLIRKSGVVAEVEAFRSAEQALDYIKKLESPDSSSILVFLDINMPVINGWDFLKRFENEGFTESLSATIVMLTSSIDPLDSERAYNSPLVAEYLTKPLNTEKIKELAGKYLT